MIPIYNLVALCFACTFIGGAIALLYSMATMWRRQRKSRPSREPFQGVDLAALPELICQMVQDSLAFRARKQAPLWPLLTIAAFSLASACKFYGHAFHPALHDETPTVVMSWLVLLLMMAVGSCLIPVVAVASVDVACRKIRKDIRERNLRHAPGVEPAV